ncbi:signal peptidase I [Staphylococcus felis]|uniref:signal peptidase I n=1 Tax=Staphylococcus felis TaxID=46127 RepID=UPI000E257011|nr:signal peptidase I [Staphylococcus felis]REI24900.1 signal peptidase I [Staphylococcus felis]REI34499.1 signal peptidase I [Staphylococcus felis]
MRKETLDGIIGIMIGLAIIVLLNWFVITPYTVKGESMSPTFESGDKVLVSKISKHFSRIDEGDVIVFHEDDNRDFIKRVIGKPGDTVEYKDDQLYVNHKPIDEPYLTFNKRYRKSEFLTENFDVSDIAGAQNKYKIPESRYLVLGDNRLNSIDSRNPHVGLVEERNIVGEVLIRFWPLHRMTFHFNPGTFDEI